jgi:hypothetical protein
MITGHSGLMSSSSNETMSEYWISAPHLNTMTGGNKSGSTVVHTPRNVDLPVYQPEVGKSSGSRKWLCLSVWLIGLILLSIGAIVVAHFLIPEQIQHQKHQNDDIFRHDSTSCSSADGGSPTETLAYKVKHSDLIVVASVLPDMTLSVMKSLKGGSLNLAPKLHKSDCFEQSSARQILFLIPDRTGRSVSQHVLYVAKFQAVMASPKVIDIVEKLALLGAKEQQHLVTLQPVKQSEIEGKNKCFFKTLENFTILIYCRQLLRVRFKSYCQLLRACFC